MPTTLAREAAHLNQLVLAPASASASAPVSEPPKPWSVAEFERYRPHSVEFVKTEILDLLDDTVCRRIVIRAPVKSGKREIAEYIAMRDKLDGPSRRVHAFISAFIRVADASQREELKEHNLKIFSILKTENVTPCIRWIEEQLAHGVQVVLHIDECDYGTGNRQLLGRIWSRMRDNRSITNILYSATPEEVLFSAEIDAEYDDMIETMLEGHIVYYTPPEGYCGPAEFLRQGLVFEARPFFKIMDGGHVSLSDQGKEIIRDLRATIATNPRRNVVVLRLTYSIGSSSRAAKKENKAIYKFLNNITAFPELRDVLVVADKGEKFGNVPRILKEDIQWSDDTYWTSKAIGIPILMVIDQTSVRSTEWRCHDRVFATHDYRPSVTYSAASQAQERVNHYKQRYGGEFQPIRVYGHRKTWELSAGNITCEEYIKNKWVKRKVDRRLTGDAELYRIMDSESNTPHPTHNAHISEDAADEILWTLGCGSSVEISPRVSGKNKQVPEIQDPVHYPCTRETFGTVPQLSEFANPFIASDREMATHPERWPRTGGQIGNLRTWGVYTHEYVVANKGNRMSVRSVAEDPRGRITICYKDGVLGVTLRKGTGNILIVDKLTAFKSMYRTNTA
jgi:hypothetical protein